MFRFIAFIMFFASLAHANLYEISNADQFLAFVEPGSIVFWDLDRTIMVFDQKPPHSAELVDSQIPKIISTLQAKGIVVLALTRRNIKLLGNTESELKKFGIDFSKGAPIIKNQEFAPSMLFKDGIIFTSEQEKGEALNPFLSQIGFKPSSLILIDDQWYNIVSVDQAAAEQKINFNGFYYRQADINDHLFEATQKITQVKIGDFPLEKHRDVPPSSSAIKNLTNGLTTSCTDLF